MFCCRIIEDYLHTLSALSLAVILVKITSHPTENHGLNLAIGKDYEAIVNLISLWPFNLQYLP